jgi:AcrR family transcriptional regulator
MGVIERRERERIETRDLILDAARELFVSEGYDGVTMRRVAEKIEYSPTAIYVHFRDKQQLFLELCHCDFRRLAETFQQIAQIPDPVERLRRTGYGYMRFALENPNHYRMMFMTSHPPLPEGMEKEMGKGNPEEDAYEFLRSTVQQALAAGAFRPELNDVNLISQTLWAGVHGVVSLEIAKGNDDWVPWAPIETRATAIIESFLQGMLRQR